jgi:hypothetical protein
MYDWSRGFGLSLVHCLNVKGNAEDEVQKDGKHDCLTTARAFVAFGDVVHGGNGWDE